MISYMSRDINVRPATTYVQNAIDQTIRTFSPTAGQEGRQIGYLV